ncbi:hypothetical protein AVI51_16440 (plasmid) [Piscirickettsia salmonis]|uniref:DUF4160 domain-containing protein n=2 Tax=Piscirickettsia salmonis TaxID=1238 RepID=UPI0006BCF753|nr:DUF4160 domain-containing protein [Piscirickettsia salmonis]ALA26749.1 transcriptional regulator [Piscirickettsia salmonis]APS49415.1 hypothetical protein AVI49_17340 [Piscirickettsia salmonis]APS52524.1 hypothetical protein AVI50_16875 [Piscirickettsia salmonis]APS55691.1 hypothetical protein AVI51_16440 [Piscirickettsia salmonis]QGP34500.1 hypothetical protein Psal161_03532 [Piscirickettsia salmonis]
MIIWYDDHLPPHIQVNNDDYQNMFLIDGSDSIDPIKGMNGKDKRLVQAWIEEHHNEFMEVWEKAHYETEIKPDCIELTIDGKQI